MSAQPIDIPIVGDSTNRPQDDPEYTLNFYAEAASAKVLTLKPTPGSDLKLAFALNGGGRGMVEVGGRLFGVRGAFLQEIVAGVPVTRGTINSTTGKVGLVYNLTPNGDFQILVVDETQGHVYKSSDNSFTLLTSGTHGFVGGGSQAAFCAGRGVVLKPGTLQFQCSRPFDFLTWEGTAFATAESLTGKLIALTSNGELLYLYSGTGLEVWQDQGYTPFPFRRVRSGDKIGILARNSLLAFERHVYWLAASDQGKGIGYRMAAGGAPERITTHAYERRIADLPTPEDALGWAYQSLGHRFYALTFVGGNVTMVRDDITSLWHDRAWRSPDDGSLFAVPYIATVLLAGELLGLDYRSGDVFRILDNVFTDSGQPIVRERKLEVIPKEADWMTYYQSAELMGETGNTPVGQDDPEIMFRYSFDRGKTFSLEESRKVGGQSDYSARTQWTGLGSGFGIVLWFRIVANQYVSWRSVRLRAE